MPTPTYSELLDLLRAAPPRQMIDDQRYWDWRRQGAERPAPAGRGGHPRGGLRTH